MADSLQVTVINETDINYIWLSVRQPQKDRQKIQPLPTVITHIHINQAELHFWSVVWKSLFYDSSSRQILFFVVLPHQSRKKKWCKRKKGTTTRVYVCASVCVCGWVDVWPLSRASSPAPHVTHLLGPNVDQDRKTIKKKKKKRFFLLWATLTLPTTEEHRVGCFWDFVFLSFVIFRGNFTTTHTHTHTHTHTSYAVWIRTVRTPEANPRPWHHRLCNDIHFSLQFTSPCWHLCGQAICARVHTVIKLPKVNKFSVCFFLKCQLCSSTGCK